MAHLLDTPHTETGDATRLQNQTDISFSQEMSFQAPAGRDDLFKNMSGARTPRNPLATMRNANARTEFTPMLKSATANRTRQVNGLLNGKITTPAALKPGFAMSNSPLPEASAYDIQSSSFASSVDGRTPVPDPSSSAMSTPMALPRRAEGELDQGNGNVLTLREQEARLEQIDKENFSLKLKIHFLEDNLRKMGPEFNVKALEENISLKSEKVTMMRDMKQYAKDLKQAEKELETYKQQLREYAEKVKQRHADEGMREEMDELRRLAKDHAAEIEQLQDKLEEARSAEDELEKVSAELEKAQAEVSRRDQLLDEYEEQAKQRHADEGMREEMDELRRLAKDRAAEIEQSQDELEKVSAELEKAQAEVSRRDQLLDEHEEQAKRIAGLKQQLDDAKREKLDIEDELDALLEQIDERSTLEEQLRDLESTLREKESQLRLLQASSKAIQNKAHQDAIDLDEQAKALTKRHIKEINGLAKQIQYLRARCSRADGFREALGYQKKFFLMQIQVYNECNQQDLNLISQMGITPDITIHERRPTLKAAALTVIAAIRMKKMSEAWAQNRKIHEQLRQKLENMRSQGGAAGAKRGVMGINSGIRIAR